LTRSGLSTNGCGAYLCNGSAACPTSCTSDEGCAADSYCAAGGTCQPRKAVGGTCNLTADCLAPGCRECQSGSCVDGVCCDSACAGGCDVCSAALGAPSNGWCTALPPQVASPACGAYLCSGAADCSCAAEPQWCGGYQCAADGVTCRTSCADTAECMSGYFCTGAVCQGAKALGEACLAPAPGSGLRRAGERERSPSVAGAPVRPMEPEARWRGCGRWRGTSSAGSQNWK